MKKINKEAEDFIKIKSDLNKINKDYNWLETEVGKFNMKPEEALVVTLDANGKIFCQKKENKK